MVEQETKSWKIYKCDSLSLHILSTLFYGDRDSRPQLQNDAIELVQLVEAATQSSKVKMPLFSHLTFLIPPDPTPVLFYQV